LHQMGDVMTVTVVLAVGFDPWMLMALDSGWRSEGYIVIPVYSIQDAMDHFKSGDFDLVLLGSYMTTENKERLTFLIRTSGSATPVVCVSSSCDTSHAFADATLRDDPRRLLAGIKELLARKATIPADRQAVYSVTT
jgi:DNA-binding response OmpR family regulator